MSVKENLALIQKNIEAACQRANRNKEEINIIAVTKYVSEETTKRAVEAGIKHLGENRDTGLLKKWEVLGSKPTWHFIGTLQSKKVKEIINKVGYIHSLDRLSLAKEIEKRADKTTRCFVQVNVSGEESKHGLTPEEVIPFIKEIVDYPKIKIVGLMTMAPYIENKAELRNVFKNLKTLQREIQALELSYAPCRELSMGMSNDYEIAVEEGATFVRIGTSLVGKEF
ncbi:YggS family pyridoxal phosphate-dependent enzyme [Bacillus taeanensis]|uniref:Pyridoxal phosphate homeostasis protein n=1 Tax=Bacillus taeanensis TaxID=273032 RepID=A0A366XLW2_9BACI|nr:YggS family pyridoxal phosphate-dependent enzyme [Bacillus taeanensis]RBW67360.1 YggS family pyridoxal phosphate-dependent enzyme [Bacillus taeanensis]